MLRAAVQIVINNPHANLPRNVHNVFFLNSETGPPVDNSATNVDIVLIFLIFHAFALVIAFYFFLKSLTI